MTSIIARLDTAMGSRLFYLLILAVGVGALAWQPLQSWAALPPYFLALMIVSTTWKCRVSSFARALRRPSIWVTTAAISFGIFPFMGYALAHSLFSGQPYWIAGFVLLCLAPTAAIASVWTDLAEGEVPLTITLIGLSTFASPFILPSALQLLVGLSVSIDSASLYSTLSRFVVIPAAAGVALRELVGEGLDTYRYHFGLVAKLCVLGIMLVNVALIVPDLRGRISAVILMGLATLIVEFIIYVAAFLIGRFVLHKTYAETVSLCYVNGTRNTAFSIAVASLSIAPAAALPATVAFVFQEPLASTVTRILRRLRSRAFTPPQAVSSQAQETR